MAILDSLAEFGDDWAVKSTGDSTNVIDTECSVNTSGFANLGAATPIWAICSVHTAPILNGSTTSGCYIVLRDCNTSSGTYLDILAGHTVDNTAQAGSLTITLVAGDVLFAAPLPAHHRRYLKLRSVSTGLSISMTCDAYLALAAPNVAIYPRL